MIEIILNYIWLLPVIMVNILCILPVSLASICNSIMDNISDHWKESIFNDPTKFDPQMWDKVNLSWKNKWVGGVKENGHKTFQFLGMTFNTLDPFSDWWHRFKLAMLALLCLSIVLCKLFYTPIFSEWEIFGLFGLAWIQPFNLFYNKLLKR